MSKEIDDTIDYFMREMDSFFKSFLERERVRV